MIVILPVCAKDRDAALRNIAWAKELDGGGVPFPCLVSCETGFDANAVIAAARGYFSAVQLFTYPAYPRFENQRWPRPQNWAWRRLALYVCKAYRDPWLWWEQDAVPIKSGWLQALNSAYSTSGKAFLGTYGAKASPGQGDHLNGVAIYPAQWNLYCPESMLFSDALAFDVCGGWRVLKHAAITSLIQHLWSFENHAGGPPCSFPNREWLAHVSKDAVLFHRCKDGSLIEQLRFHPIKERKPRSLIPKRRMRRKGDYSHNPKIEAFQSTSEVTVLITNFQRADMLWNAFQSCKRAKVAHIAITSSGVTPEVEKVLDRITDYDPKVALSVRTEDDGCNKAWIRGAQLVRTRMMTILHDDDLLLPAYQNVVAGKHKADVIHWDGAKHIPAGMIPGKYNTRPDLKEGIQPITYLLTLLLADNYNTLSPVSGCYPTNHVLEALAECESNYGPWAYLRPTMMVGNDSMIWLKACEKFKTVYYSHTPYNSYGHWPGSASFDDHSHHRMKLLPIYRGARRYFVDRCPSLVHVVERYKATGENAARIATAETSWGFGYQQGVAKAAHQWNYERDATSIGDTKSVPFLKDVLRAGLKACQKPNDFVVLTNDDTILSLYFWYAAWNWLKEHQSGCCFRRNLDGQEKLEVCRYPAPLPGRLHCGRDAFFFTQEWLRAHLDEFPDYVMGYGDWDSTLAMLIRLSAGVTPNHEEFSTEHPSSEMPNGLVYHVDHEAAWTKDPNTPGMLHNRAITNEFFEKRIGWRMPHLRGDW